MTVTAFSGRSGYITAAAQGGSQQTVANMMRWSIDVNVTMWECNSVLVAWKEYMVQCGTWSGSASGVWNMADDAGQNVFHDIVWGNTYIHDGVEVPTDGLSGRPVPKPCTGYFYVDKSGQPGSSGHSLYYVGDFYITNYHVESDASKVALVSFTFQGTGKLKLYKDGSCQDPVPPVV